MPCITPRPPPTPENSPRMTRGMGTKSPWAEAVHWATEALNHTATTANPGNKSPHETWYGTAAHASAHLFLRPAYCHWKHPSKSFPRAESCFHLGPGIDHPRDSSRVLTRANKGGGDQGRRPGRRRSMQERRHTRCRRCRSREGRWSLEKTLSREGRVIFLPPRRLH